jgi:ribosomal protein S18 acetylase RimI-like enzyme
MNDVKIRLVKSKEIERLLQLTNTSEVFNRTISETDLAITNFYSKGFWIAEGKEKVVGFTCGHFSDVPVDVLERWGASKVGEIDMMVVDPEYRNQGIGTVLLDRLIEEFRKTGVDFITLTCPVEAKDAKKFYDKYGFEVGAYFMRKKL